MSELPPLIVFGAGGHGAVVAELALACGRRVLGFADVDASRIGSRVLGLEVSWLQDDLLSMERWPEDAEVALGVGYNGPRARIDAGFAARVTAPLIHPRAYVSPSAELAPGVVVFALAAVQARARLGRGVIVNTGAVVEHDSEVRAHAHIAPNATLCGNVTVGERALVGAGASVPPGLVIGEDALVKAGSRWRNPR